MAHQCARQVQRRRQIIERLNQQEDELLRRERSTRERAQMTEEELEAEIERERERNAWRILWPL